MTDILDLSDLRGVPVETFVKTSRGNVRLYGLDTAKLESLIRQHPEIMGMFSGVTSTDDDLQGLAGNAVRAIAAAAISKNDSNPKEQVETFRAAYFSAEDELRVVQEAFRISFPGGVGAFIQAAFGLIKSLVGEVNQLNAAVQSETREEVPAVLTRDQAKP